jgi:acyl-CoA synthetase (NDP forming)
VRFGRWRDRPPGNIFTLDRGRELEIRRIIEKLRSATSEPSWVPPRDLVRLLELAGIPFAPSELTSPEPGAAATAAKRLGYPLVAKAVARGLVHKSDVGGVILGVDSAKAMRRALRTLADGLQASGYSLDGIILQRQVQGGVEVLVGVTMDPSLGPLLVAGLGGVHVELNQDVAFRLTPVSDVDAQEMLAGLRGAKLLEGFRGAPPADRDALIDLIQRVSALVDVVPELLELELNPVKVLERGQGAVAVDARLRIAGARRVPGPA